MHDALKERLKILNELEYLDTDDVHAMRQKLEVLKEIALLLVDEIEAFSPLRSVNISRGISLPDEVRSFEIHLIQSALERTGGHQTKAAQLLGINLTTLHNKLKRLNISPEPVVEAPILHEDLPFDFSPSESRIN